MTVQDSGLLFFFFFLVRFVKALGGGERSWRGGGAGGRGGAGGMALLSAWS